MEKGKKMTDGKLRRFARWAAACGFGLLAAMGATAASAKTAQDELVIALATDVRSLNGVGRDGPTDIVLHHIYETLVGFRADLSVGPALADSWDVSQDGTVYTFHLREGAKFHNGDPITSADVKWSWNFHMDPARKVSCAPNFNGSRQIKLLSLETPDEHTVVFKIEKPSPLFLTRLAEIQCNLWVACPKNVDESGAWKPDSAIGSGPFKFESRAVGDNVVLTRFKDYVASKAPASGYSGDRTALVDRLRFQIIPDATVQEVALKAGDVDVVYAVHPLRARELEAAGLKRSTSPALGWTTFLIQTNDPLLSNLKIRQAIAHAIDYKAIAKARMADSATPNPSAVADSSPYFSDRFREWPDYDPEKARALLKEAGYKGELLVIQTNTRFLAMHDNAVMLQAMLMQVGINAQIETLEWGTQLDRFNKGKFQMQSFIWSPRLDPSLAYGSFLGDKVADPSNQWDNKEAEELYRQSLTETDFAKRADIFARMHALMVQDIPIISVYYNSSNVVTGANVEGFKTWPAENPIGWGVSKK